MKHLLIFVNLILTMSAFALLMVGYGGCRDRKTESSTEVKINDNITQGNGSHFHPDSIAAWNKRALDRIKKHIILPDADTKYFTINPESGEVIGCPLLKFAGLYDDKADSILNANEESKFKKLIPKMEKAWLGTKDTSPSIEFPEGEEHYPRHGYFSANDEYIVVPDGYSHGGTVDRVYFFNIKGELINKFMLGKHLYSPSFGFNKEKTFFILSNGVGPEYYFFYPDGRVFKKGEFKEDGTSYGLPNISKSGKFWVLNNNIAWVYDKSNTLLLNLTYNGNCILDENDSTITISYGTNFDIIEILSGRIIYRSIIKNEEKMNVISTSQLYKFQNNNPLERFIYEKVY